MSSQFSYELDERQIRILMQDAELELDSAAWDRFEQMGQTEVKTQLNSFTPKINFAISRSVIVPVVFIVLIGGLSAMLFSFVDFKKKDIVKETAALPASTPTQDITPAKNETPVEKEPTPKKENSIAATATPTTSAISAKPVITAPVKEIKPTEAIVSKEPSTKPVEKKTEIIPEKKTAVMPLKKRRKKIAAEEMPIIQTSTSINLNAGSEERELELK